ncbi:polyprenyl synthetase family protein [Paenibacillus nanensis]|uniref:Polyprenyl synthetase family protein n=1 Tax=Paenibacillus nanensis TaxID=393251 RepID=A0A3A1UP52_9BACL|nr:polyprenyl synthetase family protein [Paenibacillus nanensis]RIX50338.1 polyprenyl synthetase family protein [Paenibacillus nanensis]
MTNTLQINADTWYRQAEQKASSYYSSLYAQVSDKRYIDSLTTDIKQWGKGRSRSQSWFSFLTRGGSRPDTLQYRKYIRWLSEHGKLDNYLERSVSYIYMRDLGKALDTPATQARIRHIVTDLKRKLNRSPEASEKDHPEFMSLSGVYRWAQKEGVETAIIWLIHKLKTVSAAIPDGMSAEHAVRKLIKIIVGVILHVMEEMDDAVLSAERSRRLDEAIRLGYSYGLTYPFIDDLLDSNVLKQEEKDRYSAMIRETLLHGAVPELREWTGSNFELMRFVHAELREAFEYMKKYQRPDTLETFCEQSYVFFHSQHLDRIKQLSNTSYSNEELYLPIILKSSSSRMIVRSVISAGTDEGFDQHTFYYGIYNQLADDFADLFDDLEEGAVTPYTYYLTYHRERKDLINPFEMYWAVISHLIHAVYRSDAKTRDVILDRAINGLKRCKLRLGADQYNELMGIFASGLSDFNLLIQQMVQKADDVDFLDKLLRDQMVHALRNDRREKEQFSETLRTVQQQINELLQIPTPVGSPPMKASLIDAANYSLDGSGKRLRPVLAWVMGVKEYGLSPSGIAPLLRSLEYMHTASLIFDDLPSQDNASTRRGRPTLHQVHNSATAELTGLYLIQKAFGEQASLESFEPKAVLALMRYSSQIAADMCAGQAMDLEARGKALTLEEMNTICYYKTGMAFEASLVMPAILAQVKEAEIEALKKFAYHAGIAFQIKDDLLDSTGDSELLGKPVRQDVDNNNSTFVTILGQEEAAKAMWEHYCMATEALKPLPRDTAFLQHLLDYMVSRDR